MEVYEQVAECKQLPSHSKKPKGDFGGILVQGVSSWPGTGNHTGLSSLPEELEPLGIMVVPSFAELLINFKSVTTVSDEIVLGELGRWCYPHFTDENNTRV